MASNQEGWVAMVGRSTSESRDTSSAGRSSQGAPRGLGRSTRSTGYRARSYYVPDELHFRLRNAWWATHTLPGGPETISSAVVQALEAVVGDLEDTFNHGRPFPPMPEGGALPAPARRAEHAKLRQCETRRQLGEGEIEDRVTIQAT